MKIGELEQASGIPRASIRFYEKEGLLSPARTENGYRDYSDEDLAALQKILLLRTLQVPLKDIRALQAGEAALPQVLDRQATALEAQRDELDRALRLCRELRDARLDYRDLPARKYLDSLDREPSAAAVQADVLPRVRSPFRRFFARGLDLLLYAALSDALLIPVCGMAVRSQSRGLALLDTALSLLLMLLVEPLLLHLWGATPGKWVLGLRVTDGEGGLLRYGDALTRTWSVAVRGLGLQLPVFSLVRLWKSYRACGEGSGLPWEEDSQLALRDEKPWRAGAWVLLAGAALVLLLLSLTSAGMPRHRGELTAAEFRDNLVRLARFYGYSLDSDANASATEYAAELLGENPAPQLILREDERGVAEVSIHYECFYPVPASCRDEMTLAVLSFACARKGFGLFSQGRKELLHIIESHPFESFEYAHGDVAVVCTAAYSGYRRLGDRSLFADFESTEERFCRIDFRISRTGAA